MYLFKIQNNHLEQKTSFPTSVPQTPTAHDVGIDVKTSEAHATSVTECPHDNAEKGQHTPLSFHPYGNDLLSFEEQNTQLQTDIFILKKEGYAPKAILFRLKNKYQKLYERTRVHWEVKKKQKSTKHLIADDFKEFLPVLKTIGFKPEGMWHLDQVIPGAGYSLGNVQWATPSQNNANKVAAPHNQPLVAQGIAKKVMSTYDAQTVFNTWYESYKRVFNCYVVPIATISDLNTINNRLLTRYSVEDVCKLLQFTLAHWKPITLTLNPTFDYLTFRDEMSVKPPVNLTLDWVTKNIESVSAYFGDYLYRYEKKHGTWYPEHTRMEMKRKAALIKYQSGKQLLTKELALIGIYKPN